MKICLYLEFYNFLGGILFKNIGTGLLSSFRGQKEILNYQNIAFVEEWDNSCDILQINTPWLKSIYLMKKAKRQGKKVIVWSHVTAEDVVGVFRFSAPLAPIIKTYLTYAYGLADMVFCPTEYTKSLLVAYGLDQEKMVVLSNGVDLEKYYADMELRDLGRKKFGLENMTIGTVGLVIPRKGTKTFISLAKEFSQYDFIWYGKIYSSMLAEALPEDLPLNVNFTNYVKDEDVLAAFNALDIFVFPSFEENEGMAILEAAAIGLPIIVRDIPVYEGWLTHEENCLKASSDEDFFRCIKRLAEDQSLRQKIGSNVHKLAITRDKIALAKKYEEIYDQITKQ
ncbi:MAG: Glycosyltransferase [Parcubacteria group bacterium GW2011_GWE2_39_37]|uniref:Glycosyltransferase n=1 Tax=Candidatus Falkowbacteria bacterium GW2011_GWF2_39_8 TaxID=1618642 RepID=A0A0G0T0U2_9BACT|nr:MAG: Glycosyltransferase [Parcubacteria group bacterium GW2011_GWE2_39_37]KKR31482.1 MAG: Glycosyltransferase [Candidatus Falkowbacteria bacterium GW2011_GWF2_39_8]